MRTALFTMALVAACAHERTWMPDKLTDTYVKDFSSNDSSCSRADVNLNHGEAEAFFKRAKNLDRHTLYDNYPVAPCYIEGTTRYRGESCDWQISAAQTGTIKCAKIELYFACDACRDLFKH